MTLKLFSREWSVRQQETIPVMIVAMTACKQTVKVEENWILGSRDQILARKKLFFINICMWFLSSLLQLLFSFIARFIKLAATWLEARAVSHSTLKMFSE